MRIGFGYDAHKLVSDRRLVLGGVTIPYEKGLLGHSDADVLLHSISDALLGAAALGDIGKHFPDTDPSYKDADSLILLKKSYALIKEKGYTLSNLDVTVCAQKPKLAPYIEEMRTNVAKALSRDVDCISIKATTTEKMGFTGREEGISSYCVCLLEN